MTDKPAATDTETDRWTVRGVPKRTRDAAIEAARRNQSSLGDWVCAAIDRALQAEREPLDLQAPGDAGPDPLAAANTVLGMTERAVAAAVALANAPEVPQAFRRRANRLLRESLPGVAVRKPAPRLLPAPDDADDAVTAEAAE